MKTTVELNKKRLSAEERASYAREYAGLVKHIVKRVAINLPDHVDHEDLVHEGVVGMMEALQRFDPTKGVMVKTYLTSRIRGAILDSLRSRDFASRGARKRHREMSRVEATLCQQLGRYPDRKELANAMGVSQDEVLRRRREYNTGYVDSLDVSRSPGESTETRLSTLADPSMDVARSAERNFKVAKLRESLEILPEREQLLLNLYYFEGLNVSEIAQILEVSEARISQLHRRALGKLKEKLQT